MKSAAAGNSASSSGLLALWMRYRKSRLSEWIRRGLRRASPAAFLAIAGVALSAGGTLSLIGIGQAQLASTGSRDLFAYPWFDAGGLLLVPAIALGGIGAAALGSHAAERKVAPLIIETDTGVYCLETLPNQPRKLRVRVYNSGSADLVGVRLRLLGGNPIQTPGYLRLMGDASPGCTISQTGVTVQGYHHRYFDVLEVVNNADEFTLGLANDQAALSSPLPLPSPHAPARERTYFMLMTEAQRANDGTFVATSYANFEVKNYVGSIVLEAMPDEPWPYFGKPTTPEQRRSLP